MENIKKRVFSSQVTQKSSTAGLSVIPITARPNFTAPLVPQSTPHHALAILAHKRGLLIRSVIGDDDETKPLLCIEWGTSGTLQELPCECEEVKQSDSDWSNAAIVYGVLGCLRLFAGVHILFITAVDHAGSFLDDRNEVFSIKSVSAVPLVQDLARPIIEAMASKHNMRNKMPVQISPLADEVEGLPGAAVETMQNHKRTDQAKVTFAEKDEIKVMSPLPEQTLIGRSPSPVPSTASSLSSEASTHISEADEPQSVAKTIASRLSFWSNLSNEPKRTTDFTGEKERLIDSSLDSSGDVSQELPEDPGDIGVSAPIAFKQRQNELDSKILKECLKEFTKGGMYFAYGFDITTSLQRKQDETDRAKRHETSLGSANGANINILTEPDPKLPLWRRITKQYWWNENMLKPFIDAGFHSYVLPVMQGFFQSSSFHIPGDSKSGDDNCFFVSYTLISRRSRDRAGLRYQRRGIDDDANVANFVETEAVVQIERDGVLNTFSYIQLRGSIPLYWNQSGGYSLKPAPTLDPNRTYDQNMSSLRRHFSKTISRYGTHTVVNLAEQQGKEATLARAYRENLRDLSSKDIRYCEYDFHSETKGMRYENISKLVCSLDRAFNIQGFTWFSGETSMSQQKGVFRVNCIDCLDRTNVVQSAFARHVLERQLEALAILNQHGSSRIELDTVFNNIWANNGDAISKAYAGTSALKGDYTRTGKRDINGMLNDGMNSLARMYSSTFSDWFSQAVIDFMLGNRSLSVFSEFLSRLQSTDPRDRIRIDKIRAEAIAEAVSRVLSEGERLLSGWTLLSPAEMNIRISYKLEEKVVLLSATALYIVSYDYTLEKVVRYTRISLSDISRITKGAYILSTLEEGSRERSQNYGFVIYYQSSVEQTRIASYSMRNSISTSQDIGTNSSDTIDILSKRWKNNVLSRALSTATPGNDGGLSYAAFKALPVDPARMRRMTGSFETANELSLAATCEEVVDSIVDTIRDTITGANGDLPVAFVAEEDVVGLKEAQKATTITAKFEYGLKRLIWLGS